MLLEKVSLFNSKRDFFLFFFISCFILFYSLLIEYNNYKNFTRFDSQIIKAKVLKQYIKTSNSSNKIFQVLKLKSESGLIFYSSAKKSFPDSIGKKILFEVWAGKISFFAYLSSFYAYSKVKYIYKTKTTKQRINTYIASQHKNDNITNLYQALFTAQQLKLNLQKSFSNLGISHLLAISGFHLGVLSGLLFFILKPIYNFFQNRYFPYRNAKSDIFIFISIILLSYLLFLDSPPSLLRAFVMLIIAFILYDRAIKIISIQTLFISLIILLSFFPRLSFSLGFWLSITGVFYIFLFLIHFKNINKIWQFVLVPFWVYILMLPFSLYIFSNFGIYHVFSIIWTSLFTLFYPSVIVLHIMNYGNLFDGILEKFILLGSSASLINIDIKWLLLHILFSLLSIYKKYFLLALISFSIFIFIYAIYHYKMILV